MLFERGMNQGALKYNAQLIKILVMKNLDL